MKILNKQIPFFKILTKIILTLFVIAWTLLALIVLLGLHTQG